MKFTFFVDFYIEAVGIEQYTRFGHELWLTETDMVIIMRCPIGYRVFYVTCVALLVKRSWSKNKHKQIAVLEATDDSWVWKEGWTYVLSSKSGLRLYAFNFICSSFIWAHVFAYGICQNLWLAGYKTQTANNVLIGQHSFVDLQTVFSTKQVEHAKTYFSWTRISLVLSLLTL